MRNKVGLFCMITGGLLIIGAVILLVWNQWEAVQAQKATTEVLPVMVAEIENRKKEKESNQKKIHNFGDILSEPERSEETEAFHAPLLELNEKYYLGYLSIPDLQLDLPVLAEWSYAGLKQAPCRYTGNAGADDLVIMAHNYEYHFGRLQELQEGNLIYFTDAEGNIIIYEISAKDVLNSFAVEEITSGAYDLTLFTCTYGGQSRVTVYADRVEGN